MYFKKLRQFNILSQKYNNTLLNLLISILFLVLVGCSSEECISADDFGAETVTVKLPSKKKIQDLGNNYQVAGWIDSGLYLNAKPLVITVDNFDRQIATEENNYSGVCTAALNNDINSRGAGMPRICIAYPECKFKYEPEKVQNFPCILTKGKGLYAYAAYKNATNPNFNISTQQKPNQGIAFHIGYMENSGLYGIGSNQKLEEYGGGSFKYYDYYQDNSKDKYLDGKLYFKILDNYYSNDVGQYNIRIRSGIKKESTDIVAELTKSVKDVLFGNSKDSVNSEYSGVVVSLYKSIANNSIFHRILTILLTLYISIIGISYLMGMSKLNHIELVIHIFKIGIIVTLFKKDSWNFFYKYLFMLFIDGPTEIISWVNEAANAGPGSGDILQLMMSYATLSKLMSMLFYEWSGIFYILAYFAIFIFLLIVIINATVIYLTALIMLSIIIITTPIFLTCMLFGITKQYFDNWLRMLISYALQPIILFTGIAFISFFVRDNIYKTLGFGICKKYFPDYIKINNLFNLKEKPPSSIIYWWFPYPKYTNLSNKMEEMLVPGTSYNTGDVNEAGKDICKPKKEYSKITNLYTLTLEPAYSFKAKRYPEFPFLDPNIESDCNMLKNFFAGQYSSIESLFMLLVLVYLLHKFNGTAVSLASLLAGTSGSSFSLTAAGESTPIEDLENAYSGYIKKGIYTAGKIVGSSALRGTISSSKYIYNKYNTTTTKEEEFKLEDRNQNTSFLHPPITEKEVLQKMKEKHNIDQKDINQDADLQHADLMRKIAKDAGVEKSDFRLLEDMKNAETSEQLLEHLAKAKYEKSFSELADAEKQNISDAMKPKEGEKSFTESKEAYSKLQDFKKKYDAEKTQILEDKLKKDLPE